MFTNININNINININILPVLFLWKTLTNIASVIDWRSFVPVPYSYLFLPEKRTKFKGIIYLIYVYLTK